MKKNKNIVISYGNVRILVDTIAGYYPKDNRDDEKNGCKIIFMLRSGEVIKAGGNDSKSRNAVLDFLDNHFDTKYMTSRKCEVCVNKADMSYESCDKHGCESYRHNSKFVRED